MEVPDIIGFIISVLAVIYLFGRQIFGPKRSKEDSDLDEHKQKNALKDFLRSLDVDTEVLDEEEERPKALPPPPPQQLARPKTHRRVADDYRLQTRVEQRKLETAVEKRHLQTAIEARKTHFGGDIVSPELEQHAYRERKTLPISRGESLMRRLGSKKEMVILQEILNPPRAFGKEGVRDRI